ncbi:hypothetical protein D9M72_229370 [compost metagenome]
MLECVAGESAVDHHVLVRVPCGDADLHGWVGLDLPEELRQPVLPLGTHWTFVQGVDEDHERIPLSCPCGAEALE